MMFGPIHDLGYTYAHNKGRLTAHKHLSENVPHIRLESLYQPNAFFMNHDDVITRFIAQGCGIIHATSPAFTGSILPYVRQYKNITFSLQNLWGLKLSPEPNLVVYAAQNQLSWYQAGVVAAMEAKQCMGFIAAHGDKLEVVACINSFVKGAESVAQTKVHIVTMGEWWNPSKVRVAAESIHRSFGCDVIAQYSDSFEAAQYATDNNILSVNMHSRANEYVGDNVLTCVYSDWSNVYYQIIYDYAMGNPPTSREVFPTDVSKLCELSPLARRETFIRASLFSIKNVSAEATTAMLNEAPVIASSPVVVNHGNVRTSVEVCPKPGFVMKFTPNQAQYIVPVCEPCPAFTASIEGICVSCSIPEAQVLSQCTPPESTSDSNDILPIVLPIVVTVFFLVVIGAVIYGKRNSRDTKYAPKSGKMVIAFTDIESSTEKWMSDPDSMGLALIIHHRIFRAAIKRNHCYEVKTVGDSFMIASHTVSEMLALATEAQTGLLHASWPAGIGLLRVRIGIHQCSPDVVFDKVTKGYDYVGNGVNIAARIEQETPPGTILASASTIDIQKVQADHTIEVKERGALELRGTMQFTEVVELVIPGVTARLCEENKDIEESRTKSVTDIMTMGSAASEQMLEEMGDMANLFIRPFLMRLSSKERQAMINQVAKSYGSFKDQNTLDQVIAGMVPRMDRHLVARAATRF